MYAPVARFRYAVDAGRLFGQAAPERGPLPAAVALCAGETVVHVAQAGRFCPVAQGHGERLGWCGFEMHGAGQAFALSPRVTLRCHATGHVLAQIEPEQVGPPPSRAGSYIGVAALLALIRAEEGAPDVAAIMPFAEAHHRALGSREFLEASYRMILGRQPDPSAEHWLTRDGDGIVHDLLATLAQSDEYLDNPLHHIPGPFHPDFRFTLAPLH